MTNWGVTSSLQPNELLKQAHVKNATYESRTQN